MMENQEEKTVVVDDTQTRDPRGMQVASMFTLLILSGLHDRGFLERLDSKLSDAGAEELGRLTQAGVVPEPMEIAACFLEWVKKTHARFNHRGLAALLEMAFPFKGFAEGMKPAEAVATQPAAGELSASEAVFAFASWLSTRPEVLQIGGSCDCAPLPPLIERFCLTNKLPAPRPGWEEWIRTDAGCDRCGAVVELFPFGENTEAICLGCKCKAQEAGEEA